MTTELQNRDKKCWPGTSRFAVDIPIYNSNEK